MTAKARTYQQPPATLVDLLAMGLDVGGQLGPERSGEHLLGAIANDLVDQRTTRRRVGARDVAGRW